MEKYLITIDLDGTLMYDLSSYDRRNFCLSQTPEEFGT